MTERTPADRSAAIEGDAELITATRGGDSAAFETLYLRHVDAARRLARSLVRNQSDVDDLVAEAFAKLLSTLRDGGGPDLAFRAYLLTSLRNTFYDRLRRDRRLEITADLSSHDPGVPFVDTAVEGLERSLAARAFARLPERWQMVLWHLEVEGETPAEVAPLLGLTPNGVSALAYRARERLRQAYLQEHIPDHAGADCDWTAGRLGAHVRNGLSRREETRVREHLDDCPRCRLLYAELGEVNSSLRGLLAPLVLGSAAAGYLMEPGTAAAAVASGAGAAGAGASGAGGAGAAGTAGAGAAQGAGYAASSPAMAMLEVGRGAFGFARRIVTSTGPTGVAAGSAVGAAVIAIAVGTAIFAGTGPDERAAIPNIAGSPVPGTVPLVPGPGSGGLPSPSETGTPSVSATPSDSASPSADGGSASPQPGETPGAGTGGQPGETPVPVPAPTPVPTLPTVPVPPVPVPTLPSPTFRPLLVLKVRAAALGPLIPGRGGTVAVIVTVGAPALGIPEQNLPLPLLGTGALRLAADLPPGVRIARDAVGDGWTCTGTTCRRASLGIGRGSTALLPLQIDRGARGDLTFTVSALGAATASVTLADRILPGVTPIGDLGPADVRPLAWWPDGTPCDAAPWLPAHCATLRTHREFHVD